MWRPGLFTADANENFVLTLEEDSTSPTRPPRHHVTSPSRDIGNTEENEGDDDRKEDVGENVADFLRD